MGRQRERSTSTKIAMIASAVLALVAIALLFTRWKDVGIVLFLPIIFSARALTHAFHTDEVKQREQNRD